MEELKQSCQNEEMAYDNEINNESTAITTVGRTILPSQGHTFLQK